MTPSDQAMRVLANLCDWLRDNWHIIPGERDRKEIAAIIDKEVGGWRPIETAPKDETVWCYDPTQSPRQFTGYQSMHVKYVANDKGSHDSVPDQYKWSWDESDSLTPCNPTHWQPLPNPPTP